MWQDFDNYFFKSDHHGYLSAISRFEWSVWWPCQHHFCSPITFLSIRQCGKTDELIKSVKTCEKPLSTGNQRHQCIMTCNKSEDRTCIFVETGTAMSSFKAPLGWYSLNALRCWSVIIFFALWEQIKQWFLSPLCSNRSTSSECHSIWWWYAHIDFNPTTAKTRLHDIWSLPQPLQCAQSKLWNLTHYSFFKWFPFLNPLF